MASNHAATTLTIAYWIATVPLGASLVNYSAPWLFIGWFAAILWFMALLDRFPRFNVSRDHFAVVGTVVPALNAWVVRRLGRRSFHPI